jgi:hypothetical protein
MSGHKIYLIPALILALLILAACNMPAAPTSEPADSGAIYTQAAQTVMAQLTQMPGASTATMAPGDQATATSIAPIATATPQPTATSMPTATPTPTEIPLPCNRAEFVRDVTIVDGTEFLPGTEFTKIWRLKNTGSCTWTTNYSLVFVNGDRMDGSNTGLPGSVQPGESINIGVDLVAPDESGTYKGNWMLSNGETRFGIGNNADKAFWVEIEVVQPTSGVVYNFANSYCSADWESSAGDLPCPGETGDRDGFVVRLSNPDLEHRHENEPTLWTNPDRNDDGWISGTYPAFKVKDGDRFLADIGCLEGYTKCDVIFQLNYRDNGPALKNLGEWHEVYDGKATRIDIDLSALAGKSVEFVLTVLANGESNQDAAFWLVPHIQR